MPVILPGSRRAESVSALRASIDVELRGAPDARGRPRRYLGVSFITLPTFAADPRFAQ